ncbi:N-acetyltransferase [uncultured Roseovarius sp.]|uniref:N-acetyltransferase n=1 Tax=uncultured Roseovarius sp. TaxID=293344 RepID=UPI00263217A4|nr:N-acetyltransferase [uncultured Roseovarius sp.]
MSSATTDLDQISLVEARTGQALQDFLHLPERIYADDPAWVAPLLFEQKQRVFENKPLFAHCEVAAWVAYRDGVPVGRITAQLDQMQPEDEAGKIGYFGMLEAVDDRAVFDTLFETAQGWLRARGAASVRGPYNLSINEDLGLLVDNFEDPPFIMMGHAPRYYSERLEEQGFETVKNLLTYKVQPDFVAPDVMQKLATRASRTVKIRTLDRKNKAADFEAMREMFNDGWSDNWGFVPFTHAEFEETAKVLSLLLPDDFIQIAEIEGRPVAFITAFPNINELIGDLRGRLLPFGWAKLLWRIKVRGARSARVALMGVRKEYQYSRLGPTLAFLVIDAVRKAMVQRNVTSVEMGWVLEDNDGMRHIIEAIGSTIYKRYRVYQKTL